MGLEPWLTHSVLNAVTARMRHPIAAGHKLPFHIFPERITHAAVAACQAHALANRLAHIAPLFSRYSTIVQQETSKS